MASLKAEDENFLRLFTIVSGPSKQALKVKFDECLPPSQLKDTVQNEEEKLRHLYRVGQINREHLSLLFSTSGLPSYEKMDATLMICLLRNFTSIKTPIHGYDNLPPTTEISDGADLARIKHYSHQVVQSLHDSLKMQDFNEMWTDLTGAVVRLGGTQYKAKCDSLRRQQINKKKLIEIQRELQNYREYMQRHFLTNTVCDVHNVLINRVNGMLISHYDGNLSKFLSEIKHNLYHQWNHICCCECPVNGCEISQDEKISNELFLKVYKSSKDAEQIDHVKIENGILVRTCIHSYVPNLISLEDLEISSLCSLLLYSAKLSADEQRLVSFVKTCGSKLNDALLLKQTLPEIDWFELRKSIESIKLTTPIRPLTKDVCIPVSKDANRKRNRSAKDNVAEMQRSCSIKSFNSEDRESDDKYETSIQRRPKTMHIVDYTTMQKLNKLTMRIIFERFEKNTEHAAVDNEETTVLWRIETKDNFEVMKIIEKLNREKEQISAVQKIKIVEVIRGSINIMTLVPNEILYETRKCDTSIREFLKKVVEVGEIDTSKSTKLNVETQIIPPYQLYVCGVIFSMISRTSTEDESYPGFECIVDRRLERNFRKHDQPSHGLVFCDGMFIDCISDNRLEKKCRSKENLTSTQNGHPRLALLVIYKDLMNFYTNNEHSVPICKASIMESDDSLTCRFFLENNIFIDDVEKLLSALQFAIEMQNGMCAKAIAWKIAKLFAKSIKTDFIDIWPGFKCHCKMKSEQEVPNKAVFCSSEVVIVVEMRTDNDCFKLPKLFHEIPILYKNRSGFSEEAHKVGKEIDKIKAGDNTFVGKSKSISQDKAEELFSQFSKLSLISSSPLKSQNFKINQQKCSVIPCIQLYCRAKGIIPIGESHFPSNINSIDTDVLEGYPEFLVQDVKIGSGIRTETSMGTLGGFLKYLGQNAFLTCAHVVLTKECLLSEAKRSEIHQSPIEIKCINKQHTPSTDDIPCGQLWSYAFPPDKAEDVSIDAAIVLLNPYTSKINPQAVIFADGEMKPLSYLGMTSPYLNDHCLDYKEIGILRQIRVVSAGAVSSVQKVSSNIHIERKHNAEFETLIHSVEKIYKDSSISINVDDGVHFREALLKAGQNELNCPRICTLYNQISLRNLVFGQGDSGTCIYVEDESGLRGCIGMAIAAHPNGGCIITPMTAILSYFKIR